MAKKRYTEETMTIDDLAVLMAKGFAEVKDDLRNEFLPRFDRLEQKVDALRDDVNTLFFNGQKHTARIEKLEVQAFGSIQEA